MSSRWTLRQIMRAPIMRGRITLALLLGPVLALAAPVIPADAQSASVVATNAQVQVVIVEPASLFATGPLNFGRVAARPTAGTIVVNPDNGNCTTTGGLVQSGVCSAGVFSGMGRRNMLMRINLPTSVTLVGPGGTMVMDTLTLDVAPDLVTATIGNGNGVGNQRYRITTQSGIFSFNVGGTLRVGANQPAGVYTGTYPVTVMYQ